MPLNANGEQLIRTNLEKVRRGIKPHPVVVGNLTEPQLEQLNYTRAQAGRAPMRADIMFLGTHIFHRRITEDGYSVDDVLRQIISALDVSAQIRVTPKMTILQSQIPRDDGYGNRVTDEAVFECTGKYPFPDLYSVIPKGDRIKPKPAK